MNKVFILFKCYYGYNEWEVISYEVASVFGAIVILVKTKLNATQEEDGEVKSTFGFDNRLVSSCHQRRSLSWGIPGFRIVLQVPCVHQHQQLQF